MTTIQATERRYNLVAILLHWVTAVAVVFMLGLGLYMTDLPRGSPQQSEYYQLHKSIGITILALSLFRLLWRLAYPAPPLPDTLVRWEKVLTKAVHHSFYLLLIVLPLTGWMVVSASPLGLPTRLYGVINWPHIPFIAAMENKKAAQELFAESHEMLAWITIALLLLHVAGALRHQFLLKDNLMRRMTP